MPNLDPREGHAPVGAEHLFYRDIGSGLPAIVVHGGPDFDHRYLLPEMDRLSDSLRLVYYDQRGRGRSAPDVAPESVTITSEIADLEALRAHLGFDRVALLAHSWGALLALEYAIRHPLRVSHLVLVSPAPVSHADFVHLREDRRRRAAADVEALTALAATRRYRSGDIAADAGYYRIHFWRALHRPQHVEAIVARLRLGFTPAGILKARAIEARLYDQTWSSPRYDLLPDLVHLDVPTLIVHGDHDLIPMACAEHIAQAIPGASLVVLKDCGHFAHFECPEAFHASVVGFFDRSRGAREPL